MVLSAKTSSVVSLIISVLLFSVMQYFKVQLASTEILTIVGGFLGSILFILLLTGFNNFESAFFDDYFQAKVFPEIIICLVLASAASGMVHRVCVTTCIVFSLVALYYINRISASKYQSVAGPVATKATKSKKRKH